MASGKRRSEKGVREFFVESVRTTPNRDGLEAPVKVVSSLDPPTQESHVACGGYYLDPAAAYDPVRDKVYFVYSDVSDNTCHLLLTTSTDEGKTWSKAEPVYSPGATTNGQYANPAIAVNKDGVLALTWRKNRRSSCWMFATSTDDGRSLARLQPSGDCRDDDMKPSALSTDYLWTSFFQTDSKEQGGGARINLRNTRNSILGRNEDAITATSDGIFHAVWIDAGKGAGEISTAAITVVPADTLVSEATVGLEDVTNKVAVVYGGDQRFDPETNIITLDVTIRNNSDQPLKGPFKLAVTSLYKNYGFSQVANAINKASGAGAVWDLSPTVPGSVLAAGATSKPFPLKFLYQVDPRMERNSDDIFGLNLKVFAAR